MKREIDQLRRQAVHEMGAKTVQPLNLDDAITVQLKELWMLEETGQEIIGIVAMVRGRNEVAEKMKGEQAREDVLQNAQSTLQAISQSCARALTDIDKLLNLPAHVRWDAARGGPASQ
jgi:hypothetical protein